MLAILYGTVTFCIAREICPHDRQRRSTVSTPVPLLIPSGTFIAARIEEDSQEVFLVVIKRVQLEHGVFQRGKQEAKWVSVKIVAITIIQQHSSHSSPTVRALSMRCGIISAWIIIIIAHMKTILALMQPTPRVGQL